MLTGLLAIVLPVFLLIAVGGVAGRALKLDVRDAARLTVYVFNPAITLNALLNTKVAPGEIGKIALFTVIFTLVMILVTLAVGRALGYTQSERNGSILTTTFMNCGNYGFPVVLLALGPGGFDRAAVFVVVESILANTVAVFFAAQGQMTGRQAGKAMLKIPVLWAALLGLLLRLGGIALPTVLATPVKMLADAGIVIGTVILGAQVASIRLRGAKMKIGVASFLRLIFSPVVGLVLVRLLHTEPLTSQTLVLEAATPAAINATMFALEFGTEPDLVSGITLVSTLLSLVTVSGWIWYIR